jgi:two-component system cell cycle sensor histidine kinase/response regulator CckA
VSDALPRVLVVDDNEVDRERIRRLLGAGYDVVEAATAQAGVDVTSLQEVDCVLLDHRLPDRDGVDVIEDFVGRAVPVLLLTAQGSENIAVQAMKRGAVDYLSKTALDRERLGRAVQGALESQRLRRELERNNREREAALRALEQKRAELEASNRTLAEREAQLRMMLEQVPALLWTTDRQLRYTSLAGADPAAMGIDRDTVIGRPVGEDLDASRRAHEQALMGQPARYSFTWQGMSYECNVEPMCASDGTIVGTIGVAVDVSETRLNEQRLHHAARMEALGKLSGGVAHDFNNLLTAIISFTDLARDELHESHPVRRDLDEVSRAADRAVALVRQLLAFARQDRIVPRVVEVGPLVTRLLPMLRRVCGEDLRIEVLCSDTMSTFIDRGRLEQVVINLVVNARDAMPSGGNVIIETRDEVLGEDRFDSTLPAGDYVVVEVRDDGVGMPATVVDRIFEPFFTTKEVGRGTGLGLSTVHGIVRKAGGAITVHSEVDRGTTFRVYLPRTTACEETDSAAKAEDVPRGKEWVLVVEDEEQVRAVVVRMLQRIGYRVVEAADGQALESVLDQYANRIDLLLTDVVMPDIRGPEVAALVRARIPSVAVVYMSGYSDASVWGRADDPVDGIVIEKPLRPETLGRAIRGALDARASIAR